MLRIGFLDTGTEFLENLHRGPHGRFDLLVDALGIVKVRRVCDPQTTDAIVEANPEIGSRR